MKYATMIASLIVGLIIISFNLTFAEGIVQRGKNVISAMPGDDTAEYVKDAPERVKSADWSKIKTVTIKLSEHKFNPSNLTFDTGIPYKLQITNDGRGKHYFVSEGFFKAIATRKAQSTDGEIKAPYFNAIEVYPNRSIDIYFIPVKEGNYNLKCTIAGHEGLGMVGSITIRGPEITMKSESFVVRTDEENIRKGKSLFENVCKNCHDAYSDTITIIGPGLKGLFKKDVLPISKKPATVENILNQLNRPLNKMPQKMV